MISKTAEYAIRACLWLASHADQPWTTQQIAAATGVPPGYLAKVLQQLSRASLLRAQPGPGGGFALNHTAGGIALLEIVNAVDPVPRIRACPLNLAEHHPELCPLHSRLDRALATIEVTLRECTLASLLLECGDRPLFLDASHANCVGHRADPAVGRNAGNNGAARPGTGSTEPTDLSNPKD
ncbi:MAG: Rrf2 family transcriptional regulator [Phycisphaerae bacterium]